HGGGFRGVPETGRLDAPTCPAVRPVLPPEEARLLAQGTLLGEAEPGEERPLGVWRQAHGALPPEVPLVQDRAAHPGARHSLARRPASSGILVGQTEGEYPTSDPQ